MILKKPDENNPLLIGANSNPFSLAFAQKIKQRLKTPCKIKIIGPAQPGPGITAQDFGGRRGDTADLLKALKEKKIDTAVIPAEYLNAARGDDFVIAAYLERSRPGFTLVINHESFRETETFNLKKEASIGFRHRLLAAQLSSMLPRANFVQGSDDPSERFGLLRRNADAVLFDDYELEPLNKITAFKKAGYRFFHIDAQVMVPRWGAGAPAVVSRNDEMVVSAALKLLDHKSTHVAVEAERLVAREIGADSGVLVGALCLQTEGSFRLLACAVRESGETTFKASADCDNPKETAHKMVAEYNRLFTQPDLLN